MKRATFRVQVGPGAALALRVDVGRVRFGMCVALAPDASHDARALPSPARQLGRS